MANIDSYATNSQISSSSVQTYLYSIIQAISYLNNASGKQSLQGYQQAVNKNIRLLEEDVLSSKNKVDELEKEIAKKASELELAEKDFLKYIEDNRSSHETKLLKLNNKYEEFSKEVFEEQGKIKNTHDEQITKTNEEISKIKTDLLEKTSKALTEFEKARTDKLDEPFSKKFSSIDVVTQKNTKLMYYAASTDASTADVKKFNLEYLKDDTTFNGEISCTKVNVMQDDTFSGAAIEAYYALDDLAPTLHKEHNHRLIKAYTLINDNLGYLE